MAGQRRTWWMRGVGVSGCEGPSPYKTHFQGGQGRTCGNSPTSLSTVGRIFLQLRHLAGEASDIFREGSDNRSGEGPDRMLRA